MRYYLGIDGGGTKSTFALGDERSLLATATSGPSNIVRVGETQARESLMSGVKQVCSAAGIAPREIVHGCIGAAGAARPEIASILYRILNELVPGEIDVISDTEIALQAAFGSGPGIIVIAGTGSIAYGRNARGDTARAGGWGFAISDEGSAHWIGRRAITQLLRARDRAESSGQGSADRATLESAILQKWQLRSLDELIPAANATPAPDFSALFPTVLDCAQGGDRIANEVLSEAGVQLAELAKIVIARLFSEETQGSGSSGVPLAITGGVFRHASRVREVFYNEVRRQEARVALKDSAIEPALGALELARRSKA